MNAVKYIKVIKYNDNTQKIIIKGGYEINVKKLVEIRKERRQKKEELLTKINKLEMQANEGLNFYNKQGKFDFDNKISEELDALVLEFLREYSPKLVNALRSLRRSRSELMDILVNNDFDYFLSLTFDGRRVDRLNDDVTRKKFGMWANNIKRKLPNMTYVAVLEYHKKGGLHFHVLVGNVTAEELKLVDSGKVVKNGKCAGSIIYNVGAWKIGFSTATKVYDKEAVKYYISKYLTKGGADPRFFGKKRFHVSSNIKRPEINKFNVNSKNFDIEDNFSLEDYQVIYCNNSKDYTILSNKK